MSTPNLSFRCVWNIPIAEQSIVVSGLSIPFTPTDCEASVESGSGGPILMANADRSTLSSAGGTINLSGYTTDGNSVLILNFLGFSSTLPVTPVMSSPLPPFSWQPESQTNLASPAVNCSAIEQSVMTLWAEFLSGYFNSGTHYLQSSSNFALFPTVQLMFGQMPQKQPIEGISIQLILSDAGWPIQQAQQGQWMTRNSLSVDFTIRASLKLANSKGWNSYVACRTASDLIFGLLMDKGATAPLQLRGIQRIRPRSPVHVQNSLWQQRHVRATMWCFYPSPASFPSTNTLGGDLGMAVPIP